MRTSLKIRALLLLVAVLSTMTVLSFPETVEACVLDVDQDCYYGSTYCFDPGCDGTNQCPGATCYYAGDRCCRW